MCIAVNLVFSIISNNLVEQHGFTGMALMSFNLIHWLFIVLFKIICYSL
ncbi:hypothetical protein GAGA_2144 [Paraglaciecola agarilytica NO2]|uniref:Uncharacterized protein n=1 Tax=Paraglaciecola agarilytica NO2 TaxID=1125747 RepID=A0ABQ0I6T3_9ALTE|nr:hypothetical protein GAGA_2144 [Paraglaciecola agarilytica NO2]